MILNILLPIALFAGIYFLGGWIAVGIGVSVYFVLATWMLGRRRRQWPFSETYQPGRHDPLAHATDRHGRWDHRPAEEHPPASEQCNPDAQFDLGVMYRDGQSSIPRDAAEAVKWFQRAAKQGHAGAQSALGDMYINGYTSHESGELMKRLGFDGYDVPRDYSEAAKWYQLAAEQGDADAQTQLSGMYYDGNGVPLDYEEAVKWSRLAAK